MIAQLWGNQDLSSFNFVEMAKDPYQQFLSLAEQNIKNQQEHGTSALEIKPLPSSPSAKLNMALLRAVEHMEEELCRFERNFVSSNSEILWAKDFDDVFKLLKGIMKNFPSKRIDMLDDLHMPVFDELGISYFLKDNKIEVSEESEIQMLQADLMVAESGQLLFCNKGMDYIDKLYNKKTNIIIVTIERLIANSLYVDIYSKLALYNINHQPHTINTNLFGGTPNCKSLLVIVDNQRTNLLSHKIQRQSLVCTQCGRCEAVCPIDSLIGKKPYANVFTGPIGRVVLPYLESVDTYGHVVYNCTMCGRCEEVCPMSLPLRDMMIATRHEFFENDDMEAQRSESLGKMRKYLLDRSRMNRAAWMKQQALSNHLSKSLKENMHLPKVAEKTFNQQNKK